MTGVLTPSRMGLILGALAASATLVVVTARQGHAERAKECTNNTTSLCQQIERCEPTGFEANGSCRWSLSTLRYYWKA